FMLLTAVLYRPLIGRLVVCLVPVFLVPFVNPNLHAVLQLHLLAAEKLLVAANPGPGAWSDLAGLLHRFGLVLSKPVLTIVRLVPAAATLGVGLFAVKHQSRVDAALVVLTLSVCYLMLMSPRTEEQTYIMLSASMGLYAVVLWYCENRF